MNARLFFKKNISLLLIAGTITMLLSATNAFAAAGILDSTFGSNGVVSIKSSSAHDIVLQTDGKIVILGSGKLTRYNSNGTVDTSFGVNGVVPIEVPLFLAKKVALQPGGKLIVGGQSGDDFAVVRYNSNGTLDTSFATNGMGIILGASDNYQSLGDIAVQPDGKIVFVGDTSGSQSTRTELFFARFNSDGTEDIGNIVYFSNSHNNYGKAVAIQPDGRIILSGIITPDYERGPFLSLARINQDGSLDVSNFGTGGKVAIPFYEFDNNHGALALQADGKIVLTGTVFNDGELNGNLAVARFNSNGTLDTTFGGTGIVITDFGADESINDLVIQPDGKIILGGKTHSLDPNDIESRSDFLLARYNNDGSLDTIFGTNGKVVTDFGSNIETARNIVMQPDGKVIVIGTSGEDTILARYDTEIFGPSTSLTFKSVGANDGWILEFLENSNKGGTLEKTSNIINVGDDAKDRQYRGILSFDTTSIPDNAVITSAQVKVKRQSFVGINPLNTHGTLLLEIRNGAFNNDIGLTLEDFSAITGTGSTQDKFSGVDANWVHTATLSNANLGLINKVDVTQFRLLFSKDDNDDLDADYIKLFSGNAVNDPPQLVISYSTTTIPNRPPVINGGAALSISIPENTTIVTAVTAVDLDGQSITYSISGVDAGKFSISPSTGVLAFLTPPDMESISLDTVYHLTAQASDGSLTTAQDISVTVTGVNELAPVITSNGGGAVANISLSENTMDVTTIIATDADLPTQSLKYWTAGGADELLFNLNWRDGKLSFITAPSYNMPNDADSDHVYHITVKVFDGKFYTLQELVISIINPNPPPVSMLDSTFGLNGVVTAKINGLPSSALDVLLQPDGKVVTLSNVQSTRVITHYNANGSVDTSFGTNGSIPIEVASFTGSKIGLQHDGKLMVGGKSNRGFAVVRYNSNGTLDTSFGANGMGAIEADIDDNYYFEDLTIQPDGKIVMAGSYHFNPGNHIDFQIVRFNSDGTLDAIDTIYFPSGQFDYCRAVAIQSDNKIVISGDMLGGDDGKYYIAVARQNPNARPDKSTFGTNGTATARLNFFRNSSGALALQPDGKIVVAGTVFNLEMNVPQNLVVARFNSEGSLDTTFGGSGIVVTDFGANESAADLVIQASGKIIVAGITTNQGASDFLLVRYNSDGSLDTSFGSNGKLVTDFGNSAEAAAKIVQQSDGKVIISGTSGDNAILARYNTGISGPATSLTFNSVGANDGWILESGENSSRGGTLDKVSNNLYLGDDAKDRQYRSILAFDTRSIPDNVTITSAQVKIKKQGVVGADPFNTHGNLLLEIRNGTFNNDVALTLEDFSATANLDSTKDKFSAADANWYTANLSNTNLSLLNKIGFTQFRLLFSKDDNDDMGADYAKLVSGNSTADQPQLLITYSTTGGAGNQAPVIYGGSALSISIPENTKTVAGVTAMDPDGQSITYSISGADAGKFSINPATGILTFLTAPDFEFIPSGTVYHLTAQASDGSLILTQDISVTVTPVNEFEPVVITSHGSGALINISVPENTMDVTTITATDADLPAPSIEYLLGGVDGQLFNFDASTGKLSFVTAPSYSVPNDSGLDHVYNVNFEINDGEFVTHLDFVISISPPDTSTNEILDPTFGTNGIVTTKFNDTPSSTRDIALQADGKLVVLGNRQSARIITRYNSNGSVDNTFGTNGITPIEIPSFTGSKIALQVDGKLIVAGKSNGGFAVARYNSNGALDTSFGTNGMGALDTDNDHLYSVQDVTVQPDGKIVVVGDYQYRYGNHIDFQIARFNSDGTRDVINTIDWSDFPYSRYNYGKAVIIQPDNKIVMSGDMLKDDDGKNYISLTRLNSNLRPDRSTFGTNGKGTVTARLDYFRNSSGALVLQPDGKIVIAGTIFNGDMDVPQNLVVARFNSDGALDATFGGTGIVVSDFGAQESADDLVFQANGKIIVAGTTTNLGSSDFLLVRYNSDGSLDASFGTNGKITTDFGNSAESVSGIVQQTDGKVIVSGTSGENAILARYDTGVSGTTNITSFKSVDAYDGWILESGENSSKGGTLDKNSNVFFVGDDDKDRQYRSILSFDTHSIPDNVTITSAQLKIKKQGVVGTDPFTTNGNLLLEIRSGTFSNNIVLNLEDFSAMANAGSTQDKFSAADASWYSASLSNTNLGWVNKFGVTQFRLLFSKDDNDDMGADYAKFFSGNYTTSQPELFVTYSATGGAGNQAPVIYGGAALSFSIPENTTVVAGVTAIDPDGQPVTYSISGADADKFSISPGTGVLAFLTPPDFESIPLGMVYHLKVQASDEILTAAQDIAVTVTGVNEFAPVVTSNGGGALINISLPENTIDVTTITVTDADLPSSIEYIFAGGEDGSLFTLDQATGKLSFVTAPSYNAPNDAGLDHVYTVKFEISDGEFATPLELVISILDPNSVTGFITLHQFDSQPNNGRVPYGLLTLDNGVFYGTTTYGGPPYNVPPTNPANKGNVFKMNMDGTGFTVLHEFAGGANDGWKPWSGLVISGDLIYGSTVYGGPNGESGGVIYEMNINGSGFRVLHAFGGVDDGFGASTSPILIGNTLYGLTRWGGNGKGTIYSYDTTLGVYKQLHSFAEKGTDGSFPLGTLTAANDGYLYGLTWMGGKNNLGTLFRIRPNGSSFETLYHFVGGASGKYPYDTLMFDGDHALYGSTLGEYGNNSSDLGAIFKYDITSETYSILHKFAGGSNDGGKPNGSVILTSDGLTLYGTTHGDDAWGGSEFGILYQMNIDGTGFKQLYEFNGGMAGSSPMRTPLLINGVLYGMTAYGGTENYGLIYRYQVSNESVSQLSFVASNFNIYNPVVTSDTAFSIPENTTAVSTVTATDADLPTQPLTFSIFGGADSALFNINPSTGELTFIAAPNYEVPADVGLDNIYNITLQASDGELAVTQDVVVAVTSFNENNPVITSNSVISIPENIMAVTTVTATDADLPAQPLTYSIVGGSDSALFNVNSSTGELNFVTTPDFEIAKDAGADNIYNVNVQVSDGELISTQDVAVTVTAVNDNTPVVTSNSVISIPENTMAVTTVTATDADLPAQPLTYSIVGGSDSALFNVNSSTGELNFITAPDFEIAKDAGADNIYNVTVQVSDGELISTQDIVVTVNAVNDNTPAVTSNGVILIPENSMAVTTVTATDADLPAQPLTYSIIGGSDSALFNVNFSTGELKFIAAPDFEIPADAGADNIYNATIQVTDGELISTQDIGVTVTAVNDNTPVVTSNGVLSIPENIMAVTTVSTTDADLPAQPLTYSIVSGFDSALFNVNSSTGELNFITAPDFEIPADAGADNIYNATIQVSDGELISAQDVAVTVTAVNDNTPMVTSSDSFSILENTTDVATVTAADSDLPAQTLFYSINGGADSSFFTINSSTGVLAFVTAHDHEFPSDTGNDNIYNVIVQVSDGMLNVTQNIAVNILPVNDNNPAITSLNSFSIPENTSTIAALTAVDADRPIQPLTYSISSGADVGKFSIVSATGELKFITAPDFEVPSDFNLDNIYEVVVQVSDGTYNSTQHISIGVINVD